MNTPAYRGISRRRAIQIAAAGAIAAPFVARRGFAAGNPTVVNSIRSLTNPYHATWNKGGAAFAHFNHQMTQTDFAATTIDFKGSRDVAGFVVGAGLEYALLPNLSLKAEYNYFDFGTNGYTLNCSGNPACAATPLFPVSVRQNMQTVMLGVNWRFNTGLAPLVARY